jgi:hypothetical protein
MEKIIYENDEDLMSILSESRSLPPQSAADIFYAMMNGEPLLEDPSITTGTEDADELTSPFLDVSTGSKPSSSSSSRKKRNKSNSKSHRHHSNAASYTPPTTITTTPAYQDDMDDDDDLEPSTSSHASTSSGGNTNSKPRNIISRGSKKNDSSVFYQFAHQVRTQFELREKGEKFKECVDVRDRTKNLVVYKQCFVGSEAVDAMLYSELASTREEAVELGRKLASDLNLFRHVRGRHLFKDDELYYHYSGRSQQRDAATTVSSDQSVVSSSTRADSDRLNKMAQAFRQCVLVSDRRYRLKTFKQCFVGSEAVDMLVSTGLVATRKDAVEFGRTLMRELNLFQHVTGDHAFSDEFLFFRFCDAGPTNQRLLPISLATL